MSKPIDYGKSKIKAAGFVGPISSSAVTAVSALAGTMTGTVDGTIADVADVSTSGGNTYADSVVNGAIADINLQLKELQTKLNALIAALKA